MKKQLIIIGTGPFAEISKAYFEEFTEYSFAAFSCHARFKQSDTIYGCPLYELESLKERYTPDKYDVFVAIGYGKMNKMRQAVYEEVKVLGYTCITFIHPGVTIWPSTTVGDNVFIFEDNTIQPFTNIGSNTVLWSGNHIGHHSNIGKHTFISSHVVISGSSQIGNNVFIGVNATLRDGLKIADETLIGAGAIIMKDTTIGEVYAPKATKPHRRNSEEVGF